MLQILLAQCFSSLVFLDKHSKAPPFVKGAFTYSNQVIHIFLFNTFEEKKYHQTILTHFKPRGHLKLSDPSQIFILFLIAWWTCHNLDRARWLLKWQCKKTSAPNYLVNTKNPNWIYSTIWKMNIVLQKHNTHVQLSYLIQVIRKCI